jgi:glycosyltransferase involved in cell wall biosynthesis
MTGKEGSGIARTLIISPSGNLYGSENVLLDYLSESSLVHTVAVPKGSKLAHNLHGTKHRVICFNNVKIFYLLLCLKLFLGRYTVVYLNEGGHVRYIIHLAKWFRQVRFVVHVRILEDTTSDRWVGFSGHNITVVTVSRFLQEKLSVPSKLIYDPFKFPAMISDRTGSGSGHPVQLAMIGRVSMSKGLDKLPELLALISARGLVNRFTLNIYGDITDEVEGALIDVIGSHPSIRFHGYVPGHEIYAKNDIVVHLSRVEPLGRIFFEALSAGLPLIAFNEGGIGEIGRQIGLHEFLVDCGENEMERFLDRILKVAGSYKPEDIRNAVHKARPIFNSVHYTGSIDGILAGGAKV